MMVDSRQKGARAESAIKKKLTELTGLNFQRVPASGALNSTHGLKGDLYIPNEKNKYCIEVKHYKDDQLNTQVLTNKNPTLIKFWTQTLRQAQQTGRQPLLLFKHDRSKIFVAFDRKSAGNFDFIYVDAQNCKFYIAVLEVWLKHQKPTFIGE